MTDLLTSNKMWNLLFSNVETFLDPSICCSYRYICIVRIAVLKNFPTLQKHLSKDYKKKNTTLVRIYIYNI